MIRPSAALEPDLPFLAVAAAAPPAVDQARAQLAQFFAFVTDQAVESVLGADLPIVGNALGATVTAGLLEPVRDAIDDALAAVGRGGNVAAKIAAALNGVGDGVSASAAGDLVTIDLTATDTAALGGGSFGLDIGFDGLGLDVDGAVSGSLGYALDARLTFNAATGQLAVVDKPGDVLTLSVEGSLDDLSGSGQLGFLDIAVADKLTAPELQLTGGVDISAGRVTTLGAGRLHTQIDGSADLRLGLATALGGSANDPSPLPRIFTTLAAHYGFADYDPSAPGGPGIGTSLVLKDIQIDTGTLVRWLGNVLSPVIDDLFGSYPLDKLFTTLTTPIPLIDSGLRTIGLTKVFDLIADGPFSFSKRIDVVHVTLANFEFGCSPETEAEHGLATLGGSVLTLNAGDRADERIVEGQKGKDDASGETYVLAAAPGGAVTVTAFGLAEVNSHPLAGPAVDDARAVGKIVAHMGKIRRRRRWAVAATTGSTRTGSPRSSTASPLRMAPPSAPTGERYTPPRRASW